ncbi:hypothetical protein [Promicromonospora sp. NPDC023805]|uniref:hypothetical protein n=1 Tax=Promicromonospora sp. NPDC023805 TaxID=3154696 RepID=UPI0033FC7AFD
MAVTAQNLLTEAGADETDLPLAERCVPLALSFVTQYQLESDPEELITVPPIVVDEAVLRCAEDIFTRSKSTNGVMMTNFEGAEDGGVVVRIGRDPLAPVYPIFRRWYNPVSAV